MIDSMHNTCGLNKNIVNLSLLANFSIRCSGPKFYGTFAEGLKYLFVSCVVFSFIDTHISPSPLTVLDENEGAEYFSIIGRRGNFHKGTQRKGKEAS